MCKKYGDDSNFEPIEPKSQKNARQIVNIRVLKFLLINDKAM